MDDVGTYGHFGHAVYDHDESLWHFSRSTDTSNILKPLGETRLVVQSCSVSHAPEFLREGKEGRSRRRENQTTALIKRYPELEPASGLLPDLARVSEAVEKASSRRDSTKGNLLAFGTIRDELARRQVEVVAFPTGQTGSNLRIVQVQKQRRGWHQHEGVYLKVPTIYGEGVTWGGPGVAIQSIVFAPHLENVEPLLAVQLLTQTFIFRPVLRRARKAGGSRMDVNLLHVLGLDHTQGSPPADVTFNPWYPRQLAILNQARGWTVYELEGKATERIKQLCINQATQRDGNATQWFSNDGWGRIVWVSGASTIAVCDRRRAALFDIAQQDTIELQELDVGLDRFGQIQDLVTVSSQPNCLVIVSSVHIIVYHIETARDRRVIANKVAQIRHLRNCDYPSLRAQCFGKDEDIFLFLRSDIDQTILVYKLNSRTSSVCAIADPTVLGLSPDGNTMESVGISALHLSVIEMKGSPNDALQRTQFFHITALHDDFSVHQTLYVTPNIGDRISKLKAPEWERSLTKSVHNVSDDGFVVDDEETEGIHTDTMKIEPASDFAIRFKGQTKEASRGWTVNCEHTARRLNIPDIVDFTDIDEVLETVHETLRQREIDPTLRFGLVRELAEGEITFQDTDSVSLQLERLLLDHAASRTATRIKDEMEEDYQGALMSLQSMTLPLKMRITGIDAPNHLTAVLERINKIWPPPGTVAKSDSIQHSRQQLAHRMAIEVYLASLIIRLEDPAPEEPPQSQSQSESQSQAWELPVRPGASPSSRTTPSLYLDASSQPGSSKLPTPSESASKLAMITSNSTMARLSRYTTFTDMPLPPPLPRSLKRTLAHWTISVDPASYNWTSASQIISRRDEEEVEGEELTEKERARLQRRTERYVRRQRREAEETQRMQLLSSQAPEIVSGSQPGRTVRATSQLEESQSQSQSRGRSQQQAVASQVLPGKHGGRPPKKKRKSGF